MKETDPQDNKEVTSSSGPIVNYQVRHNIPVRENKLNLSEKAYNLITTYNKTTTEVYVDKQE